MKVHFLVRTLPCAIIFALLQGCYSVEFQPAPDYPILRRTDVDAVELRRTPPRRPYDRLGRLIIRDAALDLNDPHFLRFLKGQIRERGAQGAWVSRTRRTETPGLTAGTRQADGYFQENAQLSVDTGILTLVLFNYRDDDANEAAAP